MNTKALADLSDAFMKLGRSFANVSPNIVLFPREQWIVIAASIKIHDRRQRWIRICVSLAVLNALVWGFVFA